MFVALRKSSPEEPCRLRALGRRLCEVVLIVLIVLHQLEREHSLI